MSNGWGTTVEREALLARLRERIVGYAAYKLTRDVAEDIAQDVMLVLHEKYAHVGKLEELVPLSFEIARFKITAHLRKVHRRGEDKQVSVDDLPLAEAGPNPGEYAERRELLDRLERALSRMEGRCRELFRLKLQGKNFAEIQAILGAGSLNTVYTWDYRCRQRLLELMGRREANR